MAELTLGELFAGVGGFSLGFERAGFRTVWQVEWDKHCQSVLARHWPQVERYGDVRNVAGGNIPLAGRPDNGLSTARGIPITDGEQDTRSVLAPVDVITFGSPCQDLSVAGKRAGLDGARSGLFYEAIRIIKEMRDATNAAFPRAVIWENVAGAFSSNKGADFQAVLEALADLGCHHLEWHCLDARWFGVPQRRRRVFVTAVFDLAAAERGGGQIFPVAPRSGWHPPSGDTAREDVAGTLGGGSGGRGWAPDTDRMTFIPQTAGTLAAGAHPGSYNGQDAYNDLLIPQAFVKVIRAGARDADGNLPAEVWREEDTAPTVNQFDVGETRTTVLALPSVRRLTPIECERLMSFGDNHTRWHADGIEQSDSQRYRQCGNGVVANVTHWLAHHLTQILT